MTVPLYRRVEAYPLGDFLYDREMFRLKLLNANIDWARRKQALPAADRDAIEKIERLFLQKPLDIPNLSQL